jgi:nucleoside-diphosphate-sugar epimerase
LKGSPLLRDAKGLSFVVVPDFLFANAFDDAAKGVDYIIHIASPLGTEIPADGDYQRHYIAPAVTGTLNILNAAKKAGTVKRIVVTSSMVAIQPVSAMFADTDLVVRPEDRVAELEGSVDNPSVGYIASKIAALNRSEAWMKENSPSFVLINLHPSFVFGRDESATSTARLMAGTNRLVLGPAVDNLLPGFVAGPCAFTSLDQTALTHVLALSPDVPGNQSFIISSASSGEQGYQWPEINDIVARRFAEAVKSGIFPNTATIGTTKSTLDNSKTEETFKMKHAGLEETVVPVLQQYLELLANEKVTQ